MSVLRRQQLSLGDNWVNLESDLDCCLWEPRYTDRRRLASPFSLLPPSPILLFQAVSPLPPEGCLAVYLLCTVGDRSSNPLHTAGLFLAGKQSLLQLSRPACSPTVTSCFLKLCAEAVLKISRCPKKLKRLLSPLEPALSIDGQGIKPPAEALDQSDSV